MENAKTPPPALKGTNRSAARLFQIMAGLSDGIILLGAGQRISWANDAALTMHGVAEIGGLGEDVDDYCGRFQLRYRNNHPVERGQYPIERLARGEAFSDVTIELRKVGGAETGDAGTGSSEPHWTHMVRSLVLTGDPDTPDDLALVIKDESARFDAEERFESAFNANPAPALICRLSDMRYVRVNPGFLDMTGQTGKDVIGRTFAQMDVLTHAERRRLALDHLAEGRTIPQMEASVPMLDGTLRAVIVAGQPIQMREEDCMLFTFADLERRKKAESDLRQSEERFAKAFLSSPVPAIICKLEAFTFTVVNDAFKNLTGYCDDQLAGRKASALDLWPDAELQALMSAIKADGGAKNLALQVKARDGMLIDCLVSAERVNINDEPHALCVLQDVTDRKRSRDELVAAIDSVMADTSWFSRSIVERLAALRETGHAKKIGADLNELTNREREVLGLICEGMTDAAMSRELNLSRNTIRNHVFSLYQKIGVNSRGAAIIWGRERGISGRAALRSRISKP